MHYITLDLEWNQAYREKALAVQKRLSSRLRGEVIQIGAVKLDEKGLPVGSFSVTVKPNYFRKILKHVAKLTGITQERADRGVSLVTAAESFRRFCGEDFVFLTWGPDDIPMLKDNFRIYGISDDWLNRTYDLQKIFNRQTDGGKNQKSLEFAMEYFGIPQNLPAHDALNDAYFTALVAQKLDLKRGVRELLSHRDEEMLLDTDIGNADIGDDGFVEQKEIFLDPAVKSPVCPICGKTCVRGRLFHSRGQRYSALMTCEEHGNLVLLLKFYRNFNDTWRAHYRVRPATDEEVTTFSAPEKKPTPTRRRRRRRSSKKGKAPSAENASAPEKTAV